MSDINVTIGQNTVGVSVGAAKGLAGDDGREVEIQNNGTYIQWRYVGDVSWINLVALSALTGATGATGIVVKGVYDSLTAYVPNDAVTHNGSFYICILASSGNSPSNVTYWTKYVSKGDTGADGASGTSDHTLLTNIGTNTHSQIDSHIGNTANPHSVTKTQVGLSDVDNTSDVNKPISSATQTALNAKLDSSAYNNYFKGKYLSLVALQTAHPTALDGEYALVDSGVADNADFYLWDNDEGWILGGGASPATTDALTEGSTNLYFTAARVRDTVLTGLSTVTNSVIDAADSVLVAFGKLQAQINALISGKANSSVTLGTAIATASPAASTITVPFDSGHFAIYRAVVNSYGTIHIPSDLPDGAVIIGGICQIGTTNYSCVHVTRSGSNMTFRYKTAGGGSIADTTFNDVYKMT